MCDRPLDPDIDEDAYLDEPDDWDDDLDDRDDPDDWDDDWEDDDPDDDYDEETQSVIDDEYGP